MKHGKWKSKITDKVSEAFEVVVAGESIKKQNIW